MPIRGAKMNHPVRDPRSILIIKPSSLGDVVHTLPAIACIRRRWPKARLAWLVNPEWAPMLNGNPDVDEVIEFPRKDFNGLRGWARLLGWSRKLGARIQPDMVLDFQGLLRSAVIARGVGGESWGTSDSRECARLLHHHVVRVPPRKEPLHAVNRYLALAQAVGCETGGAVEWRIPEGTRPAGTPVRFVLLHPFSRGEGKSLTGEEVAAFCRDLASIPVVIAGRGEASLSGGPNTTNLLNRTTLPEFCWLARHAMFVVSVDSGPSHIAAAVTRNLLAIHTWSDPRKVGPFQQDALVWKDNHIGRVGDFPAGEPCLRNEIGRNVADLLRRKAELD